MLAFLLAVALNQTRFWETAALELGIPRHRRQPLRQLQSNNVPGDEGDKTESPYKIVPIQIHLRDVSVEYPVTLTQRLFSAVPRRPRALNEVDLELMDPQILLVTGDSSAGKSTLLRVVAGLDKAFLTQESVVRLSCASWRNDQELFLHPNPVYLAASLDTPKYEYQSSRSVTVEDHLEKKIRSLVGQDPLVLDACRALTEQLRDIFFEDGQRTLGAGWSQSQIYSMRLLEATLESMIVVAQTCANDVVLYPAPLLLLDEWLDLETSAVIGNVQARLDRLVRATGAMVLVVTHHPQRWKQPPNNNNNRTHRLQLSMGRIL